MQEIKQDRIKEIAYKIKENSGTLYLVGGAIRNKLLGIPVTDEDYCVTGISKEKFQKIFAQAKVQGKDFPVFIIDNVEFALARKERKIGAGHKAFEFDTDEKITIEEDLARRDLTINSIAQNVLTGEIIDPFNGRKDIENKILRKTTDAFIEDPLRVYRVARFAASLEFSVDKETLNSMRKLKNELNTLSKERVFTEFKKALGANKPSIFFETLKEAEVLDVHFLEIYNLIGKVQPEKYHPEGDSYNHTLMVVDNSAKLTDDLEIRYSSLVHDLGKGNTPKEILPHHYGHDERGVKLVVDLSRRIGVPKSWEKCGKTAAKWHMKAGIFEKMTVPKQVDLIQEVSKTILGLEGLKIVVACDKARGEKNLEQSLNEIKFAKIGKECIEKIDGKFLQEKYKGIKDLSGENFAKYLREERINWVKNFQNIE